MGERLRTFYLTRDFYSNPQVIVVSAENEEKATELLNQQLATENNPPGSFGKLTELGTTKPNLIILTPPGG